MPSKPPSSKSKANIKSEKADPGFGQPGCVRIVAAIFAILMIAAMILSMLVEG